MPKYIFTLAGDQDGWDGEAVELDSPQAAKCFAVKMIAETLCENPQSFWERESHEVTVSDDVGLTQFIVEIVTTTAPALRQPNIPVV